MSLKTTTKYPRAPMRCLVVIVVAILSSSSCKGQDDTQSSVVPLLTDGDPVTEDRFPYMCSVRKRGSGRHVCGGVLIEKRWVLTAAHCLDPENPGTAGMSPFLYCNIRKREDDDSSKRFVARRCYLHHLWNGDVRNGNDIALCQLEKSANVDFPDLSNIGDAFTKREQFSVLGWGFTSSEGNLADILLIGDGLRYILPENCNDEGKWVGRIKNSMICAGLSSSNTCKGDSGGPLIIRHDPVSSTKTEDPKLDLIVGITSFGFRDCEADVPGVYTRVSCYRPWIDCIMQGTGQDCNVHDPCENDFSLCSGVTKNATFDKSVALQMVRRAITSDDSETVKQLLCDGLSPNSVYGSYNSSLLQRAAHYDAVEAAKVLLQHGADLEYNNSYGQTALSRAARYDSVSVAKLLIARGANIETKNSEGWTPLSYAARYNQLGVARVLIENGADIEGTDDRRWTPLHFAAEENSIDVAEILIDNGASIDRKERWDWTPLHLTAQEDALEVAKELIANGADVNSRERYERTPLQIAAQTNSTEVAKELIANGAIIDSRNNNRWTPLHSAALENSLEAARILLANGASISARDRWGWTALHFAAQGNATEVVEELISEGADIEAKTNRGSSPLQIAAYHGSLDVLIVLLDERAIVNSENSEGSTALHWASSRGHVSVVRILLLNGASKTKTDDDGDTPYDVICTVEQAEEPCANDDITTLQELLEV